MNSLVKNTIAINFLIVCLISTVVAELKLLSVIFRHGDRAPDNNGLEIYPRDPYQNDSFWPMGLGGLTNDGKQREYYLGEYLRKQYGHFLGDIYKYEEVSARSTSSFRAKMSLQLVLAALFPPQNNQKWKSDLDWQPIPTTYLPYLDDTLMVPEECPKYLKERIKVEASPEVRAKIQSFENFMQELSVKTGKNITNPNDMYYLYHTLVAEKFSNLPLPEWTEDIFPYDQLLEGILLEYEIFSYNTEMKRLNGGMFLRKIIDDMTALRDGSLDKNRKIFLYSGHETNVAAVLQALGVYYPHVPAYSSAVIIELHEIHSKYYVKVVYYKGVAEPGERIAEQMYIPGCFKQCSLDRFKSVLKDVTATDEDMDCDKRSLLPYLVSDENKLPYGITKLLLDTIDAEESSKNKLQ